MKRRVFAALLYRLFKRMTGDIPALAVSSILATLLHSVMVLGSMWLFFNAMPLRDVFITIASLNYFSFLRYSASSPSSTRLSSRRMGVRQPLGCCP